MKALSPKQQQIYEFIIAFQAEHGYPPSVREIGEKVGLKSPSTVHFHLKGLEGAGLITKAEGKTRAITVVGSPVQPVLEDWTPARPGAGGGERGGQARRFWPRSVWRTTLPLTPGAAPGSILPCGCGENPCSGRATSPATWSWSTGSRSAAAARSWWPSLRMRPRSRPSAGRTEGPGSCRRIRTMTPI